jgi:hypothetical protein
VKAFFAQAAAGMLGFSKSIMREGGFNQVRAAEAVFWGLKNDVL